MQYRAALSRISQAKNQKETPQDFYKNTADPKMAKLAVIFEKYENRLIESNALDFDDLLLETVRLLRNNTEVRHAYNERFRFLMIDEYQDTNRTPYELVRFLSESAATSSWSETKTSRSTAGAEPIFAIFSISSAIIRMRK